MRLFVRNPNSQPTSTYDSTQLAKRANVDPVSRCCRAMRTPGGKLKNGTDQADHRPVLVPYRATPVGPVNWRRNTP